ncbi:hypothetical protein BO86DRAFT_442715 [Aspergillus japonicus CBS 114.51]|uniref:MADS-box domain-containing protein n=1 Tax=Aspergillus japonicus CBS 114.51 TaxID=1448312 RepID=A0A8T8XA38_ASPJA|nr:hypothetical protein BO86DRAFT_442715 [Aspergillus japonicus CBS 114.51]RAH84382.1 hypothetical protein BO86DRAFT_442715 [Aspergillus japonicus CBS 114.51]
MSEGNEKKLPKVPNSPKKVVRQKRDRRKKSLIHKAYEYSKLCDADICLGIRIRDSGQVTTFQADPTGFWSGFSSHLERYYPRPVQKTDKDFDEPAADESADEEDKIRPGEDKAILLAEDE